MLSSASLRALASSSYFLMSLETFLYDSFSERIAIPACTPIRSSITDGWKVGIFFIQLLWFPGLILFFLSIINPKSFPIARKQLQFQCAWRKSTFRHFIGLYAANFFRLYLRKHGYTQINMFFERERADIYLLRNFAGARKLFFVCITAKLLFDVQKTLWKICVSWTARPLPNPFYHMLKMFNGSLGTIDNSRWFYYRLDQRIEAFGRKLILQ